MGLKHILLVASVAGFAATVSRSEGAAAVGDATANPVTSANRKTVEHDGQVFALAQSTTGKNVETDEYTLADEKIANWTQLVTVQRLLLAKPTDADAFVTYFRQRVTEDGASLDVLAPGKRASVFAVRFPKSDQNEEQVMICLAFVDAASPERLNIVQYAIKPMRCAVPTTAARLKSWRDKFIAQANAFARK